MFEIKISGMDEAKYLGEKWATRTISILDPGENIILNNTKHMATYFEDTTDNKNKSAPSLANVCVILASATLCQDYDNLLVHCKDGISKSPSMVIGILIQNGFTPKEAIEKVAKEKGYDYVVDSSSPQFLYLNSSDNIMDLVKKKLNL